MSYDTFGFRGLEHEARGILHLVNVFKMIAKCAVKYAVIVDIVVESLPTKGR
jgi:hypothetical protein